MQCNRGANHYDNYVLAIPLNFGAISLDIANSLGYKFHMS